MASLALQARVAGRLARDAGFRAFRFFTRRWQASRTHPSPGLSLRFLDEHEVASYYAQPALNLRPDSVAPALKRGDVCIGAFDGGLVGYCWLAFAPLHHLDGVHVDFDRRLVWTYKSLVLPSHRGRGIAPALYTFGDDLCRQRSMAGSLLCVEVHNGPSIRAALKAGYAPSGYAAYRKGGSGFWTWRSPAAQGTGVKFFLPD